MKKIIVTARNEDSDKVESIIEDRLFFSTGKADLIQYTLYVHDKELNDIISKLRDTIDLRYKACMIEVITPDFIVSPSLTRTKEKSPESREETSFVHSDNCRQRGFLLGIWHTSSQHGPDVRCTEQPELSSPYYA